MLNELLKKSNLTVDNGINYFNFQATITYCPVNYFFSYNFY